MESLTVAGIIESLHPIADYIKTMASMAGLSKKSTYNLRLAVDEIATNIIVHGYEEAGLQGIIQVSSTVDPEFLTIIIEDFGIPYDPLRAVNRAEETLDDRLEDRPIGGLGVYLAIQGVSGFKYERVDERNRNILMMSRSSLL